MPSSRTTDESVIARALDFIDERVLDAYATASRATASLDLVLVLDVENCDTRAFLRSSFEEHLRGSLADTLGPNAILRRLRRPAAASLENLDGERAFWLLIALPDGEVVCLAVGIRSSREGAILVA